MEISPITKKENTFLVKKINTQKIIEVYERGYSLDVKSYFKGVDNLEIHECKDSGYQFFVPRNILGDGAFYEHFQKYPWYYEQWKWEHNSITEYINNDDKVLEIGCAEGNFLDNLSQRKKIYPFGIELNQAAARIARDKGITVESKFLNELTDHYSEEFDVVCSFQVMEHIDDPLSVLADSLKLLKEGGKLIVSVPNNDSFIKDAKDNVLNMPPHHTGLWNQKLLQFLPSILPMKLEKIIYEPLQEIHQEWFIGTMTYKYPFLKIKLLEKILRSFVRRYNKKIHGHSIIAIYTKRNS